MAITLGKLEEKVKWWWPVRAMLGVRSWLNGGELLADPLFFFTFVLFNL
jgi:hypothetical protein